MANNETARLAVLIDADNASASVVSLCTPEAQGDHVGLLQTELRRSRSRLWTTAYTGTDH
ncbi:MAG TPA: hypothetical protein PK306_00915 [Aquabacterium sp.]|nr:hypothetical protein [Aquabacterium sp.]